MRALLNGQVTRQAELTKPVMLINFVKSRALRAPKYVESQNHVLFLARSLNLESLTLALLGVYDLLETSIFTASQQRLYNQKFAQDS